MKRFLILMLVLILAWPAYSQSKADSFAKVMKTKPANKKINYTDIIFTEDWHYDTLRTYRRRYKRPSKTMRIYNNKRGIAIDSANLIDYKSDTLYIFTTYPSHVVGSYGHSTIKTGKGVFDIYKNTDDTFSLHSINDYYERLLKDSKNISDTLYTLTYKESDYLLYRTVFNWDLDLLHRIFKVCGGIVFDGDYAVIQRIIIKNNRILEKDIISFSIMMFWTLDDSPQAFENAFLNIAKNKSRIQEIINLEF